MGTAKDPFTGTVDRSIINTAASAVASTLSDAAKIATEHACEVIVKFTLEKQTPSWGWTC